MEIFTIGHYSHSQEEFIELLELAEIEQLVDVRAFPGSRKFPWFKKEAMAEWLPNASIAYRHMPDLGGRRLSSDLVSPALNDDWKKCLFS